MENGKPVTVEIIRSARKTMSLEVTRDGRVLVRAPHGMSEQRIRAFVEEKKAWLGRSVAKMEQRRQMQERAGAVTQEQKRAGIEAARERIAERAAYFAPLLGVTYGRITIRDQKTRWGSCSSKGNLNFTWKLILAPPEVLDYVVVHELCHRLEMNHSERFWNHVKRILPDYRERRNWLKENGWLLTLDYDSARGGG